MAWAQQSKKSREFTLGHRGAQVLKQPNYACRANYSKARLAAAVHVDGGRMAMRKGARREGLC